ncbi:MAG: hypothetical protein C0604_08690 [Clostridiales bacterium]|mgnify:CR=1 FL=1|nr:MAG: hypothetical protein C0604_08690 [Clostridiales bacterium]
MTKEIVIRLKDIIANKKASNYQDVADSITQNLQAYLDERYDSPEEMPVEIVEMLAVIQFTMEALIESVSEEAEKSGLPSFDSEDIKVKIPSDKIIQNMMH